MDCTTLLHNHQRHCCTFCVFTPTFTRLSGLLVWYEGQGTADWCPKTNTSRSTLCGVRAQ
jgi:hypothetical protein